MSRTEQIHKLEELTRWAHNNAMQAWSWHVTDKSQRNAEQALRTTRADLVAALKRVDEILGVES